MQIIIKEEFCPKNHSCPAVKACPAKALVQKNIYSAPNLILEKCLACGRCAKTCPMGAINII